jgi:hypothetical protein
MSATTKQLSRAGSSVKSASTQQIMPGSPANMINEQPALGVLENTSDYERGLSGLSQGLQSFVTTLSHSYARKLDTILATFGCQTQLEATNAISDVSTTDFFTRTT